MEVREDTQTSGGLDAVKGVDYRLERTPLASVQGTVVSLGRGVLGQERGADDFRRQLVPSVLDARDPAGSRMLGRVRSR